MTVATKTLSSNELLALDRRALQRLADNAPNAAVAESTGTTLMSACIGRRNIILMLVGTTVVLVGISLVLIFALQSLRRGLTILVPNLVPGVPGFGIRGLAVGEVGISLSVVATMTLGIVVDDTVHFLSKYQRARRDLGCASPAAVRIAFRTVDRALETRYTGAVAADIRARVAHLLLLRQRSLMTLHSACVPGSEPLGNQGRGTIRVGTRERRSTLLATPPRNVWLRPFSCAPMTMRSQPSSTEVLRICSAG